MSTDRITIIYIGGSGRSGSTVLAHLMAQMFEGMAVGELKDIWLKGALENQNCSCGSPFLSCPFWTRVGDQAFGGWTSLPLEELGALQQRIDRFRTLPLLLSPALMRQTDLTLAKQIDAYRGTLEHLYKVISEVSGVRLIVEGSKHPANALLCSRIASVNVKVVHLVRDSRGVAWSFQKRIVRPEIVGEARLMPRASASKAALQWMMFNGAVHLLRVARIRPVRVKYEEYTQNPDEELARMGDSLQLGLLGARRDSQESLEVNFQGHSFGGNPVRFSPGAIDLKIDDQWRSTLDKGTQRYVSILTMPLLLHYGYVGRRQR